MRPTKRLRSFALVFLALACTAAFGQTSQGYLNDLGNTPYGINIPVENGFINISNGNLHLEFPIASHPQRGALSLNERLVYDSRIWMFSPFGTHGSYHWWPYNVNAAGGTNLSGGWRFVKGTETGGVSYIQVYFSQNTCDPDDNSQSTNYTEQIIWTDSSGTAHPLNAAINYSDDQCLNSSSQSISPGTATDGSGYSATDDGNGNPLVFDNSGNQVYPQVIDRYGNYFSGNGDLVDDTGRVPVITTQNGNVTYYDVLAPNGPINNNGTRVRYTVTTAPVSVATNFQQSDVYEWNPSNPILDPVQSIQLPDGSQYSFAYDGYGGLSSMTLPTGGVIQYGYGNFVDSSNTANRWLTSRTVGNNPAMTFTPSVVTGCANYGTGCVEQVNLHKPSGDETVYQLTLVNGAWNTGVTAYTGSASGGQQLSNITTIDTYTNGCFLGGSCAGQTYVSQSTSTTTVYGSQTVSSQTQTFYNPSVGKVSALKSWDYGSNFSGTPTRETDYSYTGFDTQQVIVLSNGNQAGQTNYGYTTTPAQTTSGVAQHGTQNAGGPYLQTVSHVLTGGSPSVTTYGMDDTGQVVSMSDPNGNPASTASYQCANSLPYQAKNPLGQTTQYTYDCNSGAVTGVKDPNDLASNRVGTTYAYESGAGRPQSVTYPDGGQTSYSYPSSTEVDTTVLATPSPSISSQDFLDSFGRKYQHVQAGVSSETTYDANGRPYCTTNPHLTGSRLATDGSTCITAYDGLDRPMTQQQPDGATLGWSYSGATIISTDETGKQWQRTTDSFGHLVKVIEPGSYATTYTYDGLGNLHTLSQNGAAGSDTPRLRTFLYDSLSRLTNECHPEGISLGSTCTSTGPWSASYTYDANGNTHTQKDARGLTTTLVYDALNRLTDRTYTDGTPGQHLRYDQPSVWAGSQSNTVGRLSQAYTDRDTRYFGNGTQPGCNTQSSAGANFSLANGNPVYCNWTDELYWYDPMGRQTRVETAFPSEAGWAGHETDIQYDLAGNTTALRYPDGRYVTQTWDSGSQLQKVTYDNWNGSHIGYDYLSSASYWPTGLPNTMTLGNRATQNFTMNSRLQSSEIAVSANFTGSLVTVLDKQLSYTSSCQSRNNGNIMQITDTLNSGQTQGFCYDGLNRLGSFSNGDGSMQQSYSFDAFGNLAQSGTANSQVGFAANNQINAAGYNYDQAGNMTSVNNGAGTSTYSFDQADRMFRSNAGSAFYTYNAAGGRIRKDSGNGFTEYQYLNGQPIAEKNADGSWSDYIYANGQKIARADSYDQRVHLHGTLCSGCAPGSAAWNFAISGYIIQPGDKVFWRQYQNGGPNGGFSILFTDGSCSNWVTQDANGQVANYLTVQNQWVNREVDLSQYAGKAISLAWIGVENEAGPGDWDEWFAEISIVSSNGIVTPLYNRLSSIALNWHGNATAMTNLNAFVERSNSYGDAELPAFNTTYYSGDQLGSTRLTTSGGGWPTASDTFYPFGQQPGGTAGPNHYQYAGLERDLETGLDHATFRQYSSVTGRWMSPDPYDGSMDLGNPQSLNRYSYVGNNPLGLTDPSGLDGQSPVSVAGGLGGCVGAVYSEGANPIADIGCAVSLFRDISSLFSHPKFHGSTTPRPNAHIWDEHEFSYGANPGGALGLPGGGCDFGACGGGGYGYAQGDVYAGQAGRGVFQYTIASVLELVGVSIAYADLNDPNKRLYGTHYCGPGGGGSETGQVDHFCHLHDNCYANAGITAGIQLGGGTDAQLNALGGCNQQLCDALSGLTLPYGSQEREAQYGVLAYFRTASRRRCH